MSKSKNFLPFQAERIENTEEKNAGQQGTVF
jgi:hypothetical protein